MSSYLNTLDSHSETSRLAHVPYKVFILSCFIVLIGEFFLGLLVSFTAYYPLYLIVVERFLLGVVLLFIVHFFSEQGLTVTGIDRRTILSGLKRGSLWTVATGFFALMTVLILSLFSISALPLFKAHLPASSSKVLIFIGVGGVIAPIAEEIFFRGIIFGFLRRWGGFLAIVGSTLAFVLAHNYSDGGFPLPQVLGGILFGISYEIEKNLMVPMTIHISGNTAIYLISLLNQ